MEVRILGAHQGQTNSIGFMSLLVDGVLAIDAGGLTTALTLEEQGRIEAVLVTHRHFDHIKDLVGLAHNNWQLKSTHIHTTQDVRSALHAHVFNDVVWPRMDRQIGPYHPLTWHDVRSGEEFELLGYRVLPVEVSHTVPTVGYLVSKGGRSMFYTADTREMGDPPWASLRPDLLIAETTMDNRYEQIAYQVGHMTPASLGRDLRAFHMRQGYYPRTLCCHINPHNETAVVRELEALANELRADISPAREGMLIEV